VKYEIRGLSLNVKKSGSGEPALMFLNYWGGTSRTWNKVVAELKDRFTTVAYDARGWGQSDKSVAGYTLADLADEALSLIQTLGTGPLRIWRIKHVSKNACQLNHELRGPLA